MLIFNKIRRHTRYVYVKFLFRQTQVSFYVTLVFVAFSGTYGYRWIATHSTWMFLNCGLCVRAGDSGAPGGTKGARLVALSRARWQFVCFCAGTKRTRQPRYLMSEKLFLADYYRVVFAQ